MRIGLLLNRDLHACVALNLLTPYLAGNSVAIWLSGGVGGSPPAGGELRLLRALEQAIPNEVVFPLLDRLPDGETGELRTFAATARALGASLDTLDTPNTPDGLRRLRDFAPDLLVSIRYGRILKGEALAIPPLGTLNLHSGLLPDYRGVLATMRALLAGDADVGCTIHFIDDGTIDTGAVVERVRVPVVPGASLFAHVQALYPPGIAALGGWLRALAAGEAIRREPQRRDDGAYHSWPSPADFARLAAAGIPVVDMDEYVALLGRFARRGDGAPAAALPRLTTP